MAGPQASKYHSCTSDEAASSIVSVQVPAKPENEVAGDEPAAKRPKTEPSEETVKPDSGTSEAKPMEDMATEDPVKKVGQPRANFVVLGCLDVLLLYQEGIFQCMSLT